MRVAVVGSGIVGASTVHHLAVAGAEVVLVDEGHTGKATLAGAGIVCPWPTAAADDDFYRLYADAAGYYGPFVTALHEAGVDDLGYGRVGALVISRDGAELAAEERVRRRTADRPEAGRIERIPASEAVRRFPPLRPDAEAVLIPGAARVDGRRLAAALVDAADPARLTARPGHAELLVRHDRAVGVRTAAGSVEADAVVVAGGAWTDDLLGPLGRAVAVEPQKGQIVHLHLPGVDTALWPVVLPVGPHYLLAFEDSRVVVGATREAGSGFDTRVTVAGQAEVLGAALADAPGLASATVVETRVGLRPVTADGRPVIAPVPGLGGLFVGTGVGAAGLTMGPLAGRALAALVLGTDPGLDLTPFAYRG